MYLRHFVYVVIALVALNAVCLSARAQNYPVKPIRIIANAGTSAGTDLVIRIVVNALRGSLGSIVVENRPGADGMIGAVEVKRAAADGYTLLAASENIANVLAVKPEQPVNVFEDLAVVVALAQLDFFLIVNREVLPVATVADLLRVARQMGKELNYASAATGALHHLGMELIKLRTGIAPVRVPYKAIASGITDLVAGRVHLTFTGYPAVAAQMKSGKLKILAVGSATRSPFEPDVPTLAEAGIADVEFSGGFTLYTPAGTPSPVINKLNGEINRALRTDEVKVAMAKLAVTPAGGAPSQTAAKMRADYETWVRVVKAANIKPDD